MARIEALVQDLMLASRVRTSLEASGHEVEQATDLPDELDGIDLVVADLDAVAPERLGDLGVPVIGFYQHTDVDTKNRAEGSRAGAGGPAQQDGQGAAGAGGASARLNLAPYSPIRGVSRQLSSLRADVLGETTGNVLGGRSVDHSVVRRPIHPGHSGNADQQRGELSAERESVTLEQRVEL